jgi:hypothetical protein
MLRLCTIAILAVLVVAEHAVPPQNEWVRVPGGHLIHKSCVYKVKSGEVIRDITPCPHRAVPAAPEDQIYNMDVHYTPSSELMKTMNATWSCPTDPQQDDGQTLYFWPGFKSDSPTMGLPVLQPVLQFQSGWGLASWFVYGNEGIAYESDLLNVNAGDKMLGTMAYDDGQQMWTINGINLNSQQNTTLYVSYSTVLNTDFHVAMLVLETIMDQTVCADLPASNDITFSDVSVNGHSVQWTDRIGDDSCGQAFDDKSTTVTFKWQS